ncbi:alpha/beta hydrolase family protein [Chitinimonas naiadis]
MPLLHTRPFRLAIIGLASSLLFAGCSYNIEHKDLFHLKDTRVPVASLKVLRPGDAERISPLSIETMGYTFKGYKFKVDKPKRVILYFAGSGYGAPSAMGRVVATLADEATDVYFLSYGEKNDAPPTVAAVYDMAEGLAGFAAGLSNVDTDHVYAVGHSFGGWVALHLAARHDVGCAVLMGPATDVVETSYSILPGFASALVKFKTSSDIALLDSVAMAHQTQVPVLVISSKVDQYTPERFAQRIYDSLDLAKGREIYISDTVAHESYLRDEAVTSHVRSFLSRKCDAPPVPPT